MVLRYIILPFRSKNELLDLREEVSAESSAILILFFQK